MKRCLLLAFCAVLLAPPGIAPKPEALAQETPPSQSEPDDNNWYVIDLEETPLAKGINEAWDKLPDKPHKQQDKKPPKELKHAGKKVGWASQNTMTLEYETAKQKDPKGQREDWEPAKVKVKPEKAKPDWADATLSQVPQNRNRDPQGPTTLSGGFFSSHNDDQDCVDQVNRDHFSGSDCFVGDPADHNLIPTLVEITIDDEQFCQHVQDTSVILPYDECVERGWTTLVESIDEDGPEDPDTDNDGNTDDVPNGENDDWDCTEQVEVGQDEQGNPIYELQWYGHPNCYDGDGNLVAGRLPLIDEDLVDLLGNPMSIDNDGDGLVDEDPVGELGNPQDDVAMCESFYNEMGIAFEPSQDYDAVTGECNLDHAMTKGVNEKAKEKFGKHVFKEGDPDDDANDWSKEYTATGKTVDKTYPDIGKSQYHIVLTVTDSTQSDKSKTSKCSTNVRIPGDGQPVDADCPHEDPSADFTATCTDLTCTFEADASGDNLTYAWNLGNIRKGDQSHFKDKDEAYSKGKEPRKVTVTETMIARCKPGWEYEEDPDSPPDAKKIRCKSPKIDQGQSQQGLLALDATGAMPLASGDQSSHDAMMGFTFAPPVIEWGWKIEEEVCIFGWCFEVFYARVGYEFDLGVGVRLPVRMDVQPLDANWPNVRAEQSHEFSTTITPLDFSRQEYVQFCNDHRLNDEWYIASCDRFSFPSFLNSKDGDEFVAYYSLFAGIIVRVLGIPLINWGVDSSFDLAQACTMYNALNAVGLDPDDPDLATVLPNLASFMGDYLSGDEADFYEFLKDAGILCNSFTTPYGYEPVDDSTEDGRRTFPFSVSYSIPADCTKAYLQGNVVTIKGRPVPICTNLILGTAGANLGIGLEVELEAGSENIGADWSTERDARPAAGAQTDVMWHWPESHKSDQSPPQIIGPVNYDNYDLIRDLAHDDGIVKFDDFTYYLDLWVALYANLEFGGILSPIPDLARFKLFDISFGDVTGTPGIPLPQHPGMDALELQAPVENYGLEAWTVPENVPVPNQDTREFTGVYSVTVTNLGSRDGTFDNFRADLSNVRNQDPPYTYGMNRDNDGDGAVDEDGPSPQECKTDPPPRECALDDDNDGLMNEDPPSDDWKCAFAGADPASDDGKCDFNATQVGPTAPYADADPITLTVVPFKHGMTRPGLYPVRVSADSVEAGYDPQLAARFPANPADFPYYFGEYDHIYGRRDVYDVAFVKIEAFYDPQVWVTPYVDSGKPGVPVEYNGTFVNGGNMPDSMTVTTSTIDWNTTGCSLTTLGTLPGCPYRAVPTYIPEEWMDDQFTGDYGPFEPCMFSDGNISVLTAPADWAGMTDTSYQFSVQTQSHADTSATNVISPTFTVQATKESMTRYIGLEIEELMGELEEANAQGVHTCGLLPIVKNPIKRQNDRALALILNGKLDQASKALAANAHIVEGAFLHALEGCDEKIPESPWLSDWRQRGQAILGDLLLAADCMIESAR